MNDINRRLNSILISMAACLAVLCATPFRSYASTPCTNTVQNPFDSGPGSLRDALAKASDGETITFCPSVSVIAVASPLFVSNSVAILGPGPTTLTITRANSSPLNGLFYITSNHVVTIAGLALTNGNAGGLFGGAIYNNHATLTVSNCFIGENSAADGGGIYNDGARSGSATLNVIASTFDGNVAYESGGGIYNDGQNSGNATLNIVASTLSRNSTPYGDGAAIFNLARSGSAIANVTDSTLSTNQAGFSGGGITAIGSPPILDPDNPMPIIPPVSIHNSTLNGNSAPRGDSIATFGPEVILASTILSAGSSGTNLYLNGGAVISAGYNLCSDEGSGVMTNLTDQINTPPRLGPLAHNGGPTLTHAPMCDSPAIDKGKNLAFTATDQRGARRTYDFASYPNASGGDGTDIGAVEAPIWVFNVLTTADSGAGSLRQAISNANASAGIDFIEFDPGAYGTITLTSGELSITDCLFVYGPGPTNIAVNGNYPNTTNRVFQVGPGINVTIAGLTITNGFAQGSDISAGGAGGGILNEDSALVVSNCSFVGNSVGFKGIGGGICSVALNSDAALEVVNCTVSGNSMGDDGLGGGIGNLSGFGNATLTVLNSTISTNVGSRNGGGAGILNESFSTNIASAQITGSTISSNSCGSFGGGVGNDAFGGTAEIQLVNCTFNGNSAGSDGVGGSIYNDAEDGTATAQLASTILNAGAFGANLANVVFGKGQASITSLGFNLSSDDGGGYLHLSTDLVNSDPMLGPLQDNGGPTFTHALLCGSPAIDAGTNFALLATDQRGDGFPRIFGAATDIGAFELQKVCNQAPVALCSNVTVSANSGCQASASIDAGSYDPDPADTITRSQIPAGPYPLGTNMVKLTVTDNHGASSSCTALVIVVDTTPPTVNCPGDQVVNAISPSGAVVNYPAATASDNCGLASTNYSKNAGTVFPIGTTTVTVKVTDNSGNSNTSSFTVKVNGAGEQITSLITLVNGLPGVKAAIKNALVVKLTAAQLALTNGDVATACSNLKDFINLAMAQAAKKELTSAQAKSLINEATRIRAVLACP